MFPEIDQLGRPQRALRVSVIDRCNLRCRYCMPSAEYNWLPKSDILSFEEIVKFVKVFVEAGGKKVRLTGGEPLLRRELPFLVDRLSSIEGLDEVALTTNGTLLSQYAKDLFAAGLSRLNISLDTLSAKTFEKISGRNQLDTCLEGIFKAQEVGFKNTKLDTVVIRNINDQEINDLLRFSIENDFNLRFIEYMDVGGALDWEASKVVSAKEIISFISNEFGPVAKIDSADSAAPAKDYEILGGYKFGIIASMTEPFCSKCDRSRITADGYWFDCLYAKDGFNFRELLRTEVDRKILLKKLRYLWGSRNAQTAVDRLLLKERQISYDLDALLEDPHLEMHTKGG